MTQTAEALAPDVTINGQYLYEVQVEVRKERTFWILADSLEAAKDDAANLADGLPWDDIFGPDVDVWRRAFAPPHGSCEVWVGGEKGDWQAWRDLVS